MRPGTGWFGFHRRCDAVMAMAGKLFIYFGLQAVTVSQCDLEMCSFSDFSRFCVSVESFRELSWPEDSRILTMCTRCSIKNARAADIETPKRAAAQRRACR